MTDYKRVYVRWTDSSNLFQDRWASIEDLEEHHDETFCETLGFLLKENDHAYYVAGSISPTEIGSVMQIPRVAVKELNYLETDDRDDSDSPGERGQGVCELPSICP